jgi:hypothetical protein
MTRMVAIAFCLGAALAARAETIESAEAAAAKLLEAGSKTAAVAKLDEAGKGSADLGVQVRIAEDQRAIGHVEAADQQWEKRDWKAAAAAFRLVDRDKAVPRIVTAEKLKQLQRRSGRAGRRAFLAGPLDWLGKRLDLLLDVIVPLGLVLLAVSIIRAWNRRKRKKQSTDKQINVRVLDAMKPNWPVDDGLAAKVIAELRALALPQRAQLSIESAGEAGDVATVALPDLPGAFTQVGKVLDESSALTIGIVKVPLRRIWDALAQWLDPATVQWTATIAKDQDATLVMVKKNSDDEPFHARVPGTDEAAAWTAVRLIAARISIETAQASSPTKIPEALVKFFAAVQLTNQNPPKLDDARAALISALRCDPTFWQARLRLVEVTRRLGELDLARELLKQVEADGKADEITLSYQKALISAQAKGYGELRGALQLLETLIPKFRASSTVDGRLALSVASLHAVVSAQLLSLLYDDDPAAIAQGSTEAADLERSLAGNAEQFLAPCPADTDPAFFRLASALALTARGTWLNKRNDGKAARGPLLAAIARRADYVPALVGLATAYRLSKGSDHDWFEESRPWRERALAIDPLDRDAIYEQGRALEARQPPALTEAAEAYKKISDRHAGARFYQGQLLLETDATAGVRMMLEAMRMSRIEQSGWGNAALRSLTLLPAKAPEQLRTGVAEMFDGYLALFEEEPAGEKKESREKRLSALREVQGDLRRAVENIARALAASPCAPGAAGAGRAALAISVKDPEPKLAAALKALEAALPGQAPVQPTTD